MNTETLDPAHQKKGDSKEAFNIAEYAHGKPQQAFPASLQAHESELGIFIDQCHSLCQAILRLLAKGLRVSFDRPPHAREASLTECCRFKMTPEAPSGSQSGMIRIEVPPGAY